MIPKLGPTSGYLPKGVHPATWEEFVSVFGFSASRQELLAGMAAACKNLRENGVKEVYVGGSFATKRHNPKDYDCCFDDTGLDWGNVDPVLLDYDNERAKMKAKYGGEFFPAGSLASLDPLEFYIDFFQHDKNGRKKGLVLLELATIP